MRFFTAHNPLQFCPIFCYIQCLHVCGYTNPSVNLVSIIEESWNFTAGSCVILIQLSISLLIPPFGAIFIRGNDVNKFFNLIFVLNLCASRKGSLGTFSVAKLAFQCNHTVHIDAIWPFSNIVTAVYAIFFNNTLKVIHSWQYSGIFHSTYTEHFPARKSDCFRSVIPSN